MAENDMVVFLMPDGSKVSNDPRFGLEEALQKQLDAQEYSGDEGITEAEQKAQTQVEHLASIQSGQPGVGENATVDDPIRDAHGPLGSPAQQIQKDDVKQAKEDNGSPKSTSVEDDEPVDSNEKVLEVREEAKKRAEAARKAQEKLGDDGPGDTDKPLSEWSGAQLKAEALRRNAERDDDNQLDLKGIKTKAQLVEVLEKDNAAQADADQNQE